MLSITTGGVDTNEIMDFLIADKIQENVQGFESRDAERNLVRIFLDICEFSGDHPTLSKALYVMKQSAGSSFKHSIFC